MKRRSTSLRYHWKNIHTAALLIAVLFVVTWIHWYGNPFRSYASDEALAIHCSSERATNPCVNARHSVYGEWLSNGQSNETINNQHQAAWVEYTSSDDTEFTITGAMVIDRGAANNDILDGHFIFDGDSQKRFPKEGGIGPLSEMTDPIIHFPPTDAKSIRFIIDKVSGGTADVGLTDFTLYWAPKGNIVFTARCSTQHRDGDHDDTAHDCSNALPGNAGEWWTKDLGGSDLNQSWIELTTKIPSDPLLISGITINELDDRDNVIADGHFIFKNGAVETRFPPEGGIGPVAQYRGKILPVHPPLAFTSIRFVADSVPDTASHVGLQEFGVVRTALTENLLFCDGEFVDPSNNHNYCGSCSHACLNTQWCSVGLCHDEQVLTTSIRMNSPTDIALQSIQRVPGSTSSIVKPSAAQYMAQILSSDGKVLSENAFDVPAQEVWSGDHWQTIDPEYPLEFDVPLKDIAPSTTATVTGTHTYSSSAQPSVSEIFIGLHSREQGNNNVSAVLRCPIEVHVAPSSDTETPDTVTATPLLCTVVGEDAQYPLKIDSVTVNTTSIIAGRPFQLVITVNNQTSSTQEFFPAVAWRDSNANEVLVPGGVMVPGAPRFIIKNSSGAEIFTKAVNEISQ